MPITPHSVGLHKLLGLFSPAVRPIVNRQVKIQQKGFFNTFLCKRIVFMVIEVVFRGSRKRLRSAVNIADLRYHIVITLSEVRFENSVNPK